MGRPPSSGGPPFRFLQAEVAVVEARLQQLNNAIPQRNIIQAFVDKFTASAVRAGQIFVQYKQTWFFFSFSFLFPSWGQKKAPSDSAGEDTAGRGRRAARRLLQD